MHEIEVGNAEGCPLREVTWMKINCIVYRRKGDIY